MKSIVRLASCVAAIAFGASISVARGADATPASVDAGVVGSLVGLHDLVAPAIANPTAFKPSFPGAGIPLERLDAVRSSVPVENRSQKYDRSSRDLFVNSKSIVPLLVDDLAPAAAQIVRPMSGRFVGIRASLPKVKTTASK
jgi:hypothetical protein